LTGAAAICLVLARPTLEQDLEELAGCRQRVDIAELRVDHLLPHEAAAAARFPARAGIPVILTVRRSADGGRFADTEAQRVALLNRLLSGGFAYVDLEEDLRAPDLDDAVRKSGARIVRSLHDFTGAKSG
jgi:3-dehydroquinate dehydratase/shikimate dehydrogenase